MSRFEDILSAVISRVFGLVLIDVGPVAFFVDSLFLHFGASQFLCVELGFCYFSSFSMFLLVFSFYFVCVCVLHVGFVFRLLCCGVVLM